MTAVDHAAGARAADQDVREPADENPQVTGVDRKPSTRCLRCAHAVGYHDGPTGGDPPAGRCHHVDCPCEDWLPPITEPGVYDIPAAAYHADPVEGGSLSSSGARDLLPPGCPAKYRHNQDHGTEDHRPHFDIGHAAHRLVLGDGPDIVRVEADSWRTKAAKEQQAEAYARGDVPLLADDHDQVLAMADALRSHPVASVLFRPGSGKPEQTLVWRDEQTGVMCRARLDWLPEPRARGRLIVPDYKTARSAHPEQFTKSAADWGYHQQAAFYLDGVKALGLDQAPAFVFVVQEKDPPHLVTVIELDEIALSIGRYLNRKALLIFAECQRTGHWPPYADEPVLVGLPPYYETRYTQEMYA